MEGMASAASRQGNPAIRFPRLMQAHRFKATASAGFRSRR